MRSHGATCSTWQTIRARAALEKPQHFVERCVMTKIKSAILTALVVGSSFAASSAFAGHYEIYTGGAWTSTGSATLTGATTASPVGIPVPCSSAVFTLTIPGSGGNPASVTNATFGTS